VPRFSLSYCWVFTTCGCRQCWCALQGACLCSESTIFSLVLMIEAELTLKEMLCILCLVWASDWATVFQGWIQPSRRCCTGSIPARRMWAPGAKLSTLPTTVRLPHGQHPCSARAVSPLSTIMDTTDSRGWTAAPRIRSNNPEITAHCPSRTAAQRNTPYCCAWSDCAVPENSVLTSRYNGHCRLFYLQSHPGDRT
jgi:hypothetical protein